MTQPLKYAAPTEPDAPSIRFAWRTGVVRPARYSVVPTAVMTLILSSAALMGFTAPKRMIAWEMAGAVLLGRYRVELIVGGAYNPATQVCCEDGFGV
jgi:hypothetical protein